jgi:rhamnose transport system ATP-binding protein
MEEIFQLSDRVTVFRDGKWVATKTAQETTDREIIRLMVGRQLLESSAKSQIPSASVKPLLEVRNLTSSGVFEKISFAIKPGEVVSMSGLVGAGRSEVARAIFGVDPYDGGEVLVDGKPLPAGRIKVSMRRGLALVPEDRQHLGLVLPMPVGVNLSMAVLPAVTRFGMVSAKLENPLVADLMQKLQVKAASPKLAVSSLSGGNQQKVLLGKWLATKPRILILDEPTRGVDVGAKAEIYKLVQNLASEGLAVLVISSDLPEVLLLSDRILVMRTGKISGELSRAEASQEKILSLAVPQVLEADLPASDDSQSPAAKSNDSDPNSNGSGPNPKSPNSRAGVA